jgi:hypothetical protein
MESNSDPFHSNSHINAESVGIAVPDTVAAVPAVPVMSVPIAATPSTLDVTSTISDVTAAGIVIPHSNSDSSSDSYRRSSPSITSSISGVQGESISAGAASPCNRSD